MACSLCNEYVVKQDRKIQISEYGKRLVCLDVVEEDEINVPMALSVFRDGEPL